jgi:hypothetical protein
MQQRLGQAENPRIDDNMISSCLGHSPGVEAENISRGNRQRSQRVVTPFSTVEAVFPACR